MKKRLILNILAVCLLLTAFAPAAYATETTETTAAAEETTEATTEPTTEATEDVSGETEPATSGTCGDGLTWSLDGGTLTVSGSGAMDAGAPWEAHKDSIKTVVFTGGVTVVGAEAFKDCGNLTSIDFGGSMREIDTRAFQNCAGLTSISLPSTFRRFGASSFEGCSNLKEVYCAGNMPSFNANCLWNGNYITIYHPVNNPWPQEYVQELETNFSGRLQVLAANGEDLYESTEPEETEKPTEAPTEAATEPTTVPTTQPEETEAETTEAATVPTTQAATAPTETTEAVQEITAPAEEETDEGGSWLWLFIVPLVLTVLLVGVLLIRGMLRKGGKYAED